MHINKQQSGRSLTRDAWSRILRNRIALVCLAVIAVFTLMSIYGTGLYWRYHVLDADFPTWMEPMRGVMAKVLSAEAIAGEAPPYEAQDLANRYRPPGPGHLMGTDGLGRDVFQRVVQGARIAFQVGIVTSLIAIPLGVLLGCLAGYFGGWVDDVVVWLYSTFASMPALLFIMSIAVVVGKGLLGVYLGIGLTTWVHLCRLIRGEVLKHKQLTYVTAARGLGYNPFRTVFRHIVPNLLHIVIINFSMRFPSAISTEVILSFLGIGVQGEPSWGIMISNSRFRLWQGVWWELAFTTAAIFVVVLAFNLFGDALRDALDPRLRTETESANT